MSWEAITALSTAISTVVLITTVILARHQLQLLRGTAQIEGLFRILREINSVPNREARKFVLHDLEEALKDPEFREEALKGSDPQGRHKERIVLSLYEEVGAYLKFALVDSDFLYCQAGPAALRCWKKLLPLIKEDRKRLGPTVWDSYELFVRGTIKYAQRENPRFDPGFSVGVNVN